MKKITIVELIENFESLISGFKTSKQRASKIKELLTEKLEVYKKFNLVSGVQKGIVEMSNESYKMELSKDIETAILIIEHFESSGEFRLVNISLDKFSQDESDKFNTISSKLKSVID
jgi:hypothetical protein